MLRTIFFWILFVPSTLLTILTGLPLSLSSPDYLHIWGRQWGRLLLWLGGVELTTEGREQLPDGPVIYMANHQSQFDIPALYAGIPGQFRWLAKAELFRIPLFGLAMRRAGYLPIDRTDRRKALQSMEQAARLTAAGTSVVVFPEGTRSAAGRLLAFKKGGFVLALKSGLPIVPVAIHGTGRLLPKGSRILRGGPVRVEILPPIPTAKRTGGEREQLMEEVHRTLAAALTGGHPA